MRTYKRSLVLAIALGFLLVATSPLPAAAQEATAIAVIVHAASPVDGLSGSELKAIFLGKQKYWPDGSRIVPINLSSSHSVRVAFDKKALGMSAKDVGRYWVKQKIQGRAVPPKSVPMPGIAAKMVSKIKGAISYVPLADVPAGVKVLSLDRLAPTAAGYPLKLGI